MEGRGWVTLLLLTTPAFAGCVGEPIDVALRVAQGTTETLTGSELIPGSILVERGATLSIEGADIHIEQGILIEDDATLLVNDSRLTFGGPYSRQFLAVDGTAWLERATLEGLREVVVDGALSTRDGSVGTQCARVPSGALDSRDTTWTFRPHPCESYGWDENGEPRLQVTGLATFRGGALTFERGPMASMSIQGGTLELENLTVDAWTNTAIRANGGAVSAWGATFRVRDGQRFVTANDAAIRLVDSAHPRNAWPPQLSSGARFEVLWTLHVRAASATTGAPLPGLNVTLTSADGSTASAMTDERGDTRFVALEYRYAANAAASRTGNPHLLRATDAGKIGQSPAVVLEAPSNVTLRVVNTQGTAGLAEDTLQLLSREI